MTFPARLFQVRNIYGLGENKAEAVARYNFIPRSQLNDAIEAWHGKQLEREIVAASPSTACRCPRSVWLELHGVPATNDTTWAMKQRMLLGRLFENQFAEVMQDAGILIHHWKDDPGIVIEKFTFGDKGSATYFEGVPDYIINYEGAVCVSDAKTSRSDSFGYLPILQDELFQDGGWHKNKMQLTGYYILLRSNTTRMKRDGLPLPTYCHLFSYALDDGMVRREAVWKPTLEDIDEFMGNVQRFNAAMVSPTCPACTCHESQDGFEVKFCRYGIKAKGAKVCDTCCSDDLISNN